jgi:hypothetical protein
VNPIYCPFSSPSESFSDFFEESSGVWQPPLQATIQAGRSPNFIGLSTTLMTEGKSSAQLYQGLAGNPWEPILLIWIKVELSS